MEGFDMDKVSQRLIYARKNKKLTLEEVGKILGVHKSSVLRWERGSVQSIKLSILESLAKIYNVSPTWIMGFDVPENDMFYGRTENYTIPILGEVKAGYDSLVAENVLGSIPIDKFAYSNSSEYFAIKVKGDSMQPELYQDDIVIVHKQEDFENNDLCIVLINGDEATIKRVKKIDNGIILQPANQNYDPMIFTETDIVSKPVKIIGVVKELKRNY